MAAVPTGPGGFSFLLLSDRTALARPGVFERAVDVANLLRPAFAIQLGDAIEGYCTDRDEIASQWAEFDDIADRLEAPMIRVPGNHDVSNEVMRDEWLARHGVLEQHFVHDDVLFVILDTQDPPPHVATDADSIRRHAEHQALLRHLQLTDPLAAVELIESSAEWNGPMPARLSAAQLDWFDAVLDAHPHVRWTIVCMHMPLWQDTSGHAFRRLHAGLADRPYTMFAGHVHNYRRTVIDGRDHVRLGPTGGAWVVGGDEGNFDHVTLVSMAPDGPRIANIVLDGVRDVDGRLIRHRDLALTAR